MILSHLILFFSLSFAHGADQFICVDAYHKSNIDKIRIVKPKSRAYEAHIVYLDGTVDKVLDLTRSLKKRKYITFTSATLTIKFLRYSMAGGRRAQIMSPIFNLQSYSWLCKEYQTPK